MKDRYQLLVIGAGPAGMAVAQTAARHGVKVAVIYEQADAGGQIYRNVDASPLADIDLLGRDYVFGRQLVQEFKQAPVDFFANTAVWYLDADGEIGIATSEPLSEQRAVDAECTAWSSEWNVGHRYVPPEYGEAASHLLPAMTAAILRTIAGTFPAGTGLGSDHISPRAYERLSDAALTALAVIFLAAEALGTWGDGGKRWQTR